MRLKDRIRGYLPVVIDVETSGFNEKTDALLEICAIIISMDERGSFFPKTTLHYHVKPFEGANIEPSAIKFNGIDIDNPFRLAVSEERALTEIFEEINKALKYEKCSRSMKKATRNRDEQEIFSHLHHLMSTHLCCCCCC